MSRERLLSGLAAATVFATATICVEPAVFAQGRCIHAYGTPECNTSAVAPVFERTGWRTTGLDHISFRVADPQKEAAFYAALMGWRVRRGDAARVVVDMGDWGTAIFRKAPVESFADAHVHAVVEGLGFAIEPWNAKTVEEELRKRGLNPTADNDGKGFESFHVKDPDGFDLQIGNARGHIEARRHPPSTAGVTAPAPFESTGWRTVWLDHLSLQVKDYKASASFYSNLLGWGPTYDEGSQNELMIGDVGDAIVRGGNPLDPGFGKSPNPSGGQIDHISFGISPWDTDGVKAGLEKRGLNAEVDTSDDADIHVAQYKSYHTTTPNGFNLQISASTHDTRLDLSIAVNPRRPGVPSGVAAARPNHSGAPSVDALYHLGPDSEPQPGVPQGTVTPWEKLPSEAYPGTLHDFCVYVPAQYDPGTPAALMIFQDGQAWLRLTGDYRVPYVFDNLIYRREMPVTIAVFINPGRTPEQPEASAADWGDKSTNRPQEYNALDDKYARVVTDELMPVLYKRYNISRSPDDHAIGGASSGAIAAFTVAWHRPDQFHKVLSTIGSFTNIRGGHVYPDLIRSSERKPIRIFLQDGLNDNRGMRGEGAEQTYKADWDWHAQNVKMAAALTEKGYDLSYTWGIGTHSNKQGGAILPDMMRWLWRDYVRPPDDPRDPSNRMPLVPAGVSPSPSPATGKVATAAGLSAPQLKRVSYHSDATGEERDYYVYLPEGFAQKDRWPVLMTLSGNGERGDGKDDLDYVLANGPLFEAWTQGRRLPFVIVAPQLPMFNQAGQGFITGRTRAKIRYPRPEGTYPPGPNYTGKDHMDGVATDPNFPFGLDGTPEGWSLIENELLGMIDHALTDFKGDPSRVYLTGLSTGGFGTWYMAGKHPDRFAAIAPVAAFCHPDLAKPIADAKLPLWVFTGGRDPYFKLQYFYPTLNSLEALGHPEVRFTIEEDMGHNSWNRVYAGQDLYDWFLAHRRTAVK